MLSPSETGTTQGETPETREEPGNRSLTRVLGPDSGPSKPGELGNWRIR